MSAPQITSVHPTRAVEGGRVTLLGSGFVVDQEHLPEVRVQDKPARVVFASAERLSFLVPEDLAPDGGPVPVRLVSEGQDAVLSLDLAAVVATGLHQVDNPVVDRLGRIYVTYSGTRGQHVPVSIFRISADGSRETFSSAVVNPTSMALDRDDRLYVSSRFEGVVYRLDDDGTAEPFATDLGVACGLAFAPDGTLYVGDRSGTIFAVDRWGRPTALASLPSSVAAFHLAMGPDALYVAGPTLAAYDAIYKVSLGGSVSVFNQAFGRPQGIAFGPDGALYVVEALAGASGLYRLEGKGDPELLLSCPGLIGVAFDPRGGAVVCSNDTAYRLRW